MESRFPTLALATSLALTSSLGAAPTCPQEEPELLLSVGDEIWPTAPVVSIQNCATLDSGDWWATVLVNLGGPTAEYAWVVNGQPVAWSGQAVGPGLNPSLIRHGSLDENGNQYLLIAEGSGPTAPNHLLVNNAVALSDGMILSGLPGSTGPFQITRLQAVAHRGGRLVVTMTTGNLTPSGPPPFAVVSYDVSPTGVLSSLRLDYATGAPMGSIPGRFRAVQGGISVSSDGDLALPLLYRLQGTEYNALLIEGVEVLRDGQPSPVAGAEWVSPARTLASAAGGLFAASGTVRDAGGNLVDVVVNGDALNHQVIAEEGSSLPAIPGNPVTVLGAAAVAVDDNGRTAFTAALTSGTQHLIYDGRSLIKTGETQAGGRTITRVQAIGAAAYLPLSITPSGDWLVAIVELANGDRAAVRVDLDRGTQVAACPAAPNSTGQVAVLESFGSRSLGADQLLLRARNLPLQAFGLLVASKTTGFVANPGGSTGNLCLSGQIHRFDGAIASSGSTGTIESRIRLSVLPAFAAAVAGETLFFQQWHREVVQTSTSNFTTAVGVTFL